MVKTKDRYEIWIAENESKIQKTDAYRPFFTIFCFAAEKTVQKVLRCSGYSEYELLSCPQGMIPEYLARARGEYVVLLAPGMIPAEDFLWKAASYLGEHSNADRFVYGDEDSLDAKGKRVRPFFKPDWSPDLLLSISYVCSLMIMNVGLTRIVADEMNAEERTEQYSVREYLYDFALRATDRLDAAQIGHIQEILCHNGVGKNDRTVLETACAYREIVSAYLAKKGIQATVETNAAGGNTVCYALTGAEQVSIIIPSKDNVELLKRCVTSLRLVTTGIAYELILVDNGSTQENRELLSDFCAEHSVKYIYQPMPFNFATMCNIGAAQAEGNLLVFLNDDMEVPQADWLVRMAGQAQCRHTGAVGVKLYYPEGNILQHAGVANLGMGPSHYLCGMSDAQDYYFGRNRHTYNCLAVTAACVMIERAKFEQVGGFDEQFAVAYNDVDVCFALARAGYVNVQRNDVTLFHHESASRGLDALEEKKMARLIAERTRLWDKYPEYADGVDPYYSKNLAPDHTDFRVKVMGGFLEINRFAGILNHPEGLESPFSFSVDSIVYERELVVRGWYYFKDDKTMAHTKAYLVLKDEDGRCYTYETCKQEREDVSKALQVQEIMCGYSCRIDRADNQIFRGLDGENRKFLIGLMIETFPLRRKLVWSDKRL